MAAVEPDFSIDHIKTNCSNLDILRKGRKLADVSFLVNDKCFKAHKIVLAAASPVFLAMFESGMKESLSNEIVLTDADPEGFENFLQFVYSGGVPDMKHAVTLLNLADKYHILVLFDLCVDHMEKTLNEINVSERFQLADLHGVFSLKNACLEFIKDNLESVSGTSGWACISNDLRLTTLVAQSLKSLPIEAVTPDEFVEVTETKEVLCKTSVKTVQWSIKWATVLNHEVLRDPEPSGLLETGIFDVALYDDTIHEFYLYLTKSDSKKYGTKVTFWLGTIDNLTVDMDCLAVLHSAIPNGECRRLLKFSFNENSNRGKPLRHNQNRQILSFHMSDGHFSIDNAIKLSLIFQQPGENTIVRESGDKVLLEPFAKLARTDEFSDVTFDVSGTEFRGHRVILAGHSDLFKDWFQNNPQSTYSVENVDPETFDTLLNFIYCGKYPEPKSITVDLLQAAAWFGLVDLAKFCSLMVAENVTVDNAIRLLKISRQRGAENLKEPVLKFITSNLNDVIGSADWQTLENCSATVTELLLSLSRQRAQPAPSKPITQERARCVNDTMSINFMPDIFEKDY